MVVKHVILHVSHVHASSFCLPNQERNIKITLSFPCDMVSELYGCIPTVRDWSVLPPIQRKVQINGRKMLTTKSPINLLDLKGKDKDKIFWFSASDRITLAEKVISRKNWWLYIHIHCQSKTSHIRARYNLLWLLCAAMSTAANMETTNVVFHTNT